MFRMIITIAYYDHSVYPPFVIRAREEVVTDDVKKALQTVLDQWAEIPATRGNVWIDRYEFIGEEDESGAEKIQNDSGAEKIQTDSDSNRGRRRIGGGDESGAETNRGRR